MIVTIDRLTQKYDDVDCERLVTTKIESLYDLDDIIASTTEKNGIFNFHILNAGFESVILQSEDESLELVVWKASNCFIEMLEYALETRELDDANTIINLVNSGISMEYAINEVLGEQE